MNNKIVFADEQFEKIIRDALNKSDSDITSEDMRGIKRLYIGHTNLLDISPVEYCLELESIMIEKSEIDLRPFSELPKLRLLDITAPTANELKDIELFKNLRSLSVFSIGGMRIDFKRYSHLKNLRSIRSIDISGNVFDCDALSGFDFIEKLTFVGVKIKNTAHLQKLTALKEFVMEPVFSDDYVQLRTAMENMPSLTKVDFNNSSMDAAQVTEVFGASKWAI